MARMPNSWIVLIALTGLVTWVAGQQQPQVPNRIVNARLGYNANFTCGSHGVPLSMCLWERLPSAESNLVLNFLPATARPGQGPISGYTYMGEGFEKGQCGLVIDSVKDVDNGTWQCSLFTSSGTFYRGEVNLGILRKPNPPMLNPNTLGQITEEDSTVPGPTSTQLKEITCYSANGEPKPTFQWFIDDQPLTENLGPINETKQSSNDGGELIYTFQNLRNHKFTYRDNGKKLRCVVVHDALTENDKKEVSADIIILYRPRAADGHKGNIPVQAVLGEEKIVSLNVSSNPRPTTVEWTVDGKIIKEGQSNDDYEALVLKQVETGIWETSLRIKGVAEEDLTRKFNVKLANPQGSAEFFISINSSSAGSGGLNAGGIVGIILIAVLIIIVLGVGLVYTRAKGILCFKGDDGTASEKERMDGGSTGVGAGAAEEKPSRSFSTRLSALYENLVSKKKDKTAVVDEEAGKEKETKEKEPLEGEAAVSDEKEKKPDDIVYAELDLARSGGDAGGPRPEVRCADDKTEYAEIVGVVPQAKTVDETSPKKSPQGSPKK